MTFLNPDALFANSGSGRPLDLPIDPNRAQLMQEAALIAFSEQDIRNGNRVVIHPVEDDREADYLQVEMIFTSRDAASAFAGALHEIEAGRAGGS